MQGHPNSVVDVCVPDGLSGHGVRVDYQTVVDGDRRNLPDEAEHLLDIVGHPLALQVHISRGPPGVVRSQQNPTLEHKPVGVRRGEEAREKPLQRVI
jgi:hypothetical protein